MDALELGSAKFSRRNGVTAASNDLSLSLLGQSKICFENSMQTEKIEADDNTVTWINRIFQLQRTQETVILLKITNFTLSVFYDTFSLRSL